EVEPIHAVPLIGEQPSESAGATPQISDPSRRRRKHIEEQVAPRRPHSPVGQSVVRLVIEVSGPVVPQLPSHLPNVSGYTAPLAKHGHAAGRTRPLGASSAAHLDSNRSSCVAL